MNDVEGTILYLGTCHGMAKSLQLLGKAAALEGKDAVKNREKVKQLIKKAQRAYRTAEIVQDAVLPEERMPDWKSFCRNDLGFKVDASVPTRLRYKGKEVLSHELFQTSADAMTRITDKGNPSTESLQAAMREKYYYWVGEFFLPVSDEPESDFDISILTNARQPLHAEFQAAHDMNILKHKAAWMLDVKVVP
jgi:hypothetical protein